MAPDADGTSIIEKPPRGVQDRVDAVPSFKSRPDGLRQPVIVARGAEERESG
jgi:hypothetical protein